MVRSALAGAGKTQKELAEYMGWSPQNLSGRLKNGTLTFDELNKALGFVGYSVKMVSNTGSELPALGNSGSPRVVQMVGGVTYDTSKSESLCTSKETPDDKLYMSGCRRSATTFGDRRCRGVFDEQRLLFLRLVRA